WQGVRACRRAKVPVLVRGDSQLATPRSLATRLAKELTYGMLLRQFDGFLVVGNRNREYLAHYGVRPDRVFLAPHFIDNKWFGAFKNQTQLPGCYVSADVLVLPSDGGETWGLVVNEAMACGLPVVVSDAVGCGPDLIEEGRTGFSFRCRDTIHLAQRLSLLAD